MTDDESQSALNQACKIRYFADWPLHTALGHEEECKNYATGNYSKSRLLIAVFDWQKLCE